MNDWLVIYRAYTPEEIAEEIKFLREEMKNPYSAQGLGSQSAQRDLGALKNRLQAALQVRGEQNNVRLIQDTVVDFSGGVLR